MVSAAPFSWDTSFRIVATRVPRIRIFEDVARPEDLENVLKIEAIANDRLREAARTIHLVPIEDRVVGPGASFVMAPFAYVRPGRFSPGGVRGVYYAGESIDTAIAETAYHRARFLADTNEKPIVVDHRLIEARIAGMLVDVGTAPKKTQTATLDPDAYGASYAFGAKVYAAGHDGVRFRSVRRAAGICVGIYRPRCVRDARTTMYLGYRWDGRAISDVFQMQSLTTEYPPEPGARLGG